ncbi:ribosome recycling factor family protein [Photobacterium rosenbergii]|uniref:ribosome recycling factor family protein n=1 Tax=Photobacterium rosenbergii TaxID=294936 RepID=UPI001C98FA4C|nr:ribosome recycling factor family protein [Photobacterium rosenbergii]MBY5947771.1 ribosome recycling factor family protein [Photobacterium rosenbergii]
MMKPSISINLPSLAHKITTAGISEINAVIAPYACVVKRVRRSRNYALIGTYSDLVMIKTDFGQLVGSKNCLKWQRVYQSYLTGLEQLGEGCESVTFEIKNITATLGKSNRSVLLEKLAEIGIKTKRKAHQRHLELTGSLAKLNALQSILQDSPSEPLAAIGKSIHKRLAKYHDLEDIGFDYGTTEQPRTLLSYVVDNPAITVAELCFLTNCSTAEARKALDDYFEL